MALEEMRFKCLELAAEIAPEHFSASDVVRSAGRFYEFVIGAGEREDNAPVIHFPRVASEETESASA